MRRLPKPCDENGVAFLPAEVFELCISRIRDRALRLRLQSIRAAVANAGDEYNDCASNLQLHQFPRHAKVGCITKAELVDVYTNRMVPKTQPGRKIYDKIFNAPELSRCPLCGVGTVKTLDHHLPKAEYPVLAVTPNNLVPSCSWCQDAKKERYPTIASDQTIHPYFDDFEAETWLRAEVEEGIPAVFRFFSDPPVGWTPAIAQRLAKHLEMFRLPELYTSNAGSELVGIRKRLSRLHLLGGLQAVRNHLVEEATSREEESKNSWKTAMYRAAAASDWFCDEGFAGV